MDSNTRPIPTIYTTIQEWPKETPDDFRFSIKSLNIF